MTAYKRKADGGRNPDEYHDRPAKKPRHYTQQHAQLAKMLDSLSSHNPATRTQAARELTVSCAEQTFTFSETATSEEANYLKTVILRLIRGLCSSRKAARMGFYMALTELCREKLPTNPGGIKLVMLEIEKETDTSKASSGQEKRDFQIGRVSALSSIFHSEVLFDSGHKSAFEALVIEPNESFKMAVAGLVDVAKNVPWLREECGLTLCQTVRLLAKGNHKPFYVTQILDSLKAAELLKTPQGIAIWLEVMSLAPAANLPKKIWHKFDPLSRTEVATLSTILRQTSEPSLAVEEGAATVPSASGARQHTPSFAWDTILQALVVRSAKGRDLALAEARSSMFGHFWNEVVDNGFFSSSASVERKSLGFQILTKVINSLPAWTLGVVFSPKLKSCLINQSAKSDRYLHETARTMLGTVVARAKRDGDAASPLVEVLMFEEDHASFDELTGTKTIKSLLAGIGEGLPGLVQQYCEHIQRPHVQKNETNKERKADTIRQAYASHLLSLVRDRVTDKDVSSEVPQWLVAVVDILSNCAYHQSSDLDATYVPIISSATTTLFRARLNSVLGHILKTQPATGAILVVRVAQALGGLQQSETEVGKSADKHAWNILQKGNRTLVALGQISSRASSMSSNNQSRKERQPEAAQASNALRLMLAMAIVAAFDGDLDSFSVIDELQDCYDSIFGERASSSPEALTGQAFDMIIEIILSLMSKGPSLYRTMSEQVFETFAAQVSPSALQSMLDILKQHENSQGQEALFEREEEIQEDDGEQKDEQDKIKEDGSDDDVEVVESGGDDCNSDTEAETSDNDDASEEAEDDDELARFDKLLAATLKTSAQDGTNGEAAEDESSDEDMNDDEMMALEPNLTKIFQQRKAASASGKTREKKDAKQNMLNFKNRVLDLLLIYVRQQYDNALCLDLIVPLLQLIRTTSSKQIGEKSFNLLKRYFDTSKKAKSMPKHDNTQRRSADMAEVHTEALLFVSKMHAAACSRASLFLARVLLDADEAEFSAIVDLYGETHKKARATNSKLTPSFWIDWINWSSSVKRA